jgi:hypothetical protein
MQWYVAKLIFRIVCGDGEHLPQFDEQLRLFMAHTLQEALHKARSTGEAEATCFVNQQQQLVHWRFIDVSDLHVLHEVIDGTELYSRIEERSNAQDYEAWIKQKALYIEAQIPSLQLT